MRSPSLTPSSDGEEDFATPHILSASTESATETASTPMPAFGTEKRDPQRQCLGPRRRLREAKDLLQPEREKRVEERTVQHSATGNLETFSNLVRNVWRELRA
jgi:hypothetical protein